MASPLFITWVLLSTINLCGYTHHNAHPSITTPTIHPPSYHPPMPPPTIYPLNCHSSIPTPSKSTQKGHSPKCHYPPPTHKMPPLTTHTPILHQKMSPRLESAPQATRSPPSPTQHKTTHTKVGKTICTHQALTLIKRRQNTSNKISIKLPPKKHHSRSILLDDQQIRQLLFRHPLIQTRSSPKNSSLRL